MTAVIRAPGEGERHAAGPAEVVLKATADETGGALFLAEATVPPGSPTPPPHRHERMYDMFWVLEGILTVRVGTTRETPGPGRSSASRPAPSTRSPTTATPPSAS